MIELSIIIVNWNCLDFTVQCLDSIAATTRGVEYEVIVIDNASMDAPCRIIAERFPWVKLILSDENLGFGRANNLGVSRSAGRYLLFLNPDTVVVGDALLRMLTEAQARPRAGAVGCKLLNADGTIQTSRVLGFPTIANQLLSFAWLQRKLPHLSLWGQKAFHSTSQDRVHEVEVVPGAALLVSRPIFEQVGRFSPEYFMYAEEVDLCFAIRRAAWANLHVRDAEIVHFGGQSTKQCEDGFSAVTMRESVYRFFRRNHGRAYAIVYRVSILLSAMCRIALLICLLPFTAVPGARLKYESLAMAFRKWQRIARWALGFENSRRNSSPRTVPVS
jgi:hypothetical protein